MNDQELVVNYQPFPGNVPGEGYIPVTTKASIDPPSTSDHWRYEKLTQVTDADKQQIQTNKENIATLQEEVSDLETEIDEKSVVSGTNDGTNWTNITINGTTKAIPSGGGGGFTPTQTQLDAMNSGIDSTKVAQIATNTSEIAGKQAQLSTAQLNACNSGIDSTKVAQIQTNATNIANKVDKVTGKGLSTNDYTTEDQTKVGYIGNGVETLTFTLADSSTVTLKVVKGA